MKWTTFHYSDPKYTIQICHPQVAKARREYISRTYGAEPKRVIQDEVLWIDLGGAIRFGSPQIFMTVGKGRAIGCWVHQMTEVAYKLRLATKTKINGRNYRRFGSFLNRLNFISERDAVAFLAFLDSHKNESRELEYKADIQMAFEDAQGLPRGSLAPSPLKAQA